MRFRNSSPRVSVLLSDHRRCSHCFRLVRSRCPETSLFGSPLGGWCLCPPEEPSGSSILRKSCVSGVSDV
jgi:hypothetical protein